MHIEAVTSYLDTWEVLSENHGDALEHIHQALALANPPRVPGNPTSRKPAEEAWLSDLSRNVHRSLRGNGWERKTIGRGKLYKTLEHTYDRIGLTLFLGKPAFLLQSMFTRYPPFLKSGEIDKLTLLVPMKSVTRHVSGRVASFERVTALMSEVSPRALGYPFAVVGFAEKEPTTVRMTRIGNPMDGFLLKTIGMPFEEMTLLGERPEYDFKLSLPDNRKLSHEACGMSNLAGGGLLLFGVADDGDAIGVPNDQLDEMKLQITNIIRSTLEPVPRFSFEIFPVDSGSVSSILILKVDETELKPCMVGGRAYIRSGPSVRVAASHEVRKMVLGFPGPP